MTGNEYVSSLPLQMLLYFNMFFSPFWLIATAIAFELKVRCCNHYYGCYLGFIPYQTLNQSSI